MSTKQKLLDLLVEMACIISKESTVDEDFLIGEDTELCKEFFDHILALQAKINFYVD